MASSVVTIKVEKSTLQLLKALKEETGSKNFDEAIRKLAGMTVQVPKSMFGAHPEISSGGDSLRHHRSHGGGARSLQATGGEDAPQLDFSELDISDLAPPDDDDDDLSLAELTLDDVTDRPVAREENSGQALMGTGAGLEDLHVDDLDLEIPSLPPAGSVTGKKMRPSVKTGTALDDFEIDLGELTNDDK